MRGGEGGGGGSGSHRLSSSSVLIIKQDFLISFNNNFFISALGQFCHYNRTLVLQNNFSLDGLDYSMFAV